MLVGETMSAGNASRSGGDGDAEVLILFFIFLFRLYFEQNFRRIRCKKSRLDF